MNKTNKKSVLRKFVAILLCFGILSTTFSPSTIFADEGTPSIIISYKNQEITKPTRYKPLTAINDEFEAPYEIKTISEPPVWELNPDSLYHPADDEHPEEISLLGEITPFSDSTFTSFNTITSPTISNGANEPKSAFSGFLAEEVSPYSGELTMRFNDLTLEGRNGLDLNIGRIYQSSAATVGDMKMITLPNDSGILRNHTIYDFSTYNLNRYNLGTGWAFSFPSVQIETEYIPEEIGDTYYYIEQKEMYYHTGTGAVYQIDNSTPSHLKDYYGSDVLFSNNDPGYSNGQVTSKYSFERADKTKEYFAADGRLIGVKDRFNNVIKFEHTMQSVVSRVPDGDFEMDNDMWTVSETSGSPDALFSSMGRFDNSSIRFRRYKSGDAYILSQPIQVEPSTNYTLSTSFYNTNGDDIKIEVIPVDVAYQPRTSRHTFWATNIPTGQWYDHTVTFGTSTATRYVFLKYTVENGAVDLHIDHVRLDNPKPLISKITDSIEREVTFDYTGNLTANASGAVTLTVTSPDGYQSKTMIYNKTAFTVDTKYNNINDRKYIWYLLDSDTECDMNGENGNKIRYSYEGDLVDGNYPLLYSDAFSKTHSTNDTKCNKPVLGEVQYKDRRIMYKFAPIRKHLGDRGYYDTLRVTDRWEEYGYLPSGASTMSFAGQQGKTSYTYSGTYSGSSFNNETGYPNYTFNNTTTLNELWNCEKTQYFDETTTNRLKTTSTFQNAKLKEQKEENLYDSTANTLTYTYHSTYNDSPTEIKSTITKGADTTEKYMVFTYNTWGGLASETLWVDETTRNSPYLLEKYATTYTYHPTYKIVTQKSWYGQLEEAVFTETNTVDSLGRITETVNAANEKKYFYYTNPSYSGNVTSMKQIDPMHMHQLIGSDRSVLYTYDTYGLYVEDETEISGGQIRNHVYEHEYIYGNIMYIQYPDGSSEQYHYYPNDGRLYRKFSPYVQANGYLFYFMEQHEYHPLVIADTYADSVERIFQLDIISTYRVRDGVAGLYSKVYSLSDAVGNLKKTDVTDYTRYDPVYQTAPYIATQYFHDKFDRLSEVRDDANNKTQYKYDPQNRPLEITDARGSKYKYEYNDAKSETLSYFSPISSPATEQNHFKVKYDLNGNISERSAYPGGLGGTALTEYYDYDTQGNLIWYKDPKGYETVFKYDGLGRLEKTELPTNESAVSTYNSFGEPAFEKIYDENGKAKSSRGSLVNESGGLKNRFYLWNELLTDTNSYNSDVKNRITSVSEGGNIIGYAYDHSDNIVNTTSGSAIMARRYERFGITISAANDASITTTAYGYDDLGRMDAKVQNGLLVGYDYNTLNLPTTFENPSSRTEAWGYDDNGALKTIATGGKNFSYDYYDNGMVHYVNYPNNLKTEYIYDNMNRVTDIVTTRGAATINTLSYTYDANSNMTSETRNGTTYNFTYDELNRLKTANYGDGNTITYHYDALNNRTQETHSNGDVVDYVYNKKCQLEAVKLNGTVTDTYTYNGVGAVLTRNGQAFTYDQWNRLDSIDNQSYKYDADGIRTEINGTEYLTDAQNRVVAEINGDTVSAEIIYGHQPLARKVGSSWYYYIYNAHGDVIGMVNDSGTVVNNYTYDAWGNVNVIREDVPQPIKYAGEFYDSDTGLYYLRARYYDPKVGRFTSLDEVTGNISNPLDMNRYVYGRNNPVKYKDPSGKVAIADDAIIIVIIAGTVVVTTYAWLTSPEGQKAIADGATAIYNGVVIAGKAVSDAVISAANAMANAAAEGAEWVGDKASTAWNTVVAWFSKPSNLPSYKKIGIDMDHIMSGHSAGGNRGGPNKDRFPWHMTAPAIENAIREAYRNGEKVMTQGDRVFVRGSWGQYTIEMWVNKATKIIESAWPKY